MMKLLNPARFVPDWDKRKNIEKALWLLIVGYSLFQAILLVLIFTNHLLSPDILRGLQIEVIHRLLNGLPIYSLPSAEYIGFVHNPMSAVWGAVFSTILGEGVTTLRLVTLCGALGAWVLIFKIVKSETKSVLAGLIALGLFASAYLSFDGYLDFSISDSWLLFCSLFGLYTLNKSNTPKGWAFGVLLLSISFWFKQHGAIMAVGGLVFLTIQIRQKSIPYWLLAFVLVPLAYLFVGPFLFGDQFIYYTYIIPSGWSTFQSFTVVRIIKYFGKHWAVLGALSLLGLRTVNVNWLKITIWECTLPFALLVGLLGSLDPGSENNQYIIPGVWFIICGSIAFYKFYISNNAGKYKIGRSVVFQILILLAFLQNYYHIPSAFFPASAWQDYTSLIAYIDKLDGDVYMPSVGQMSSGVRLRYTATWVQLEDLVRGRDKPTYDLAVIQSILIDIIEPQGKVYIITVVPLEQDPLLSFLGDYYVLIDDFGDKYKSLRAVPGRYPRGWLRYVYEHK